MFKYLYIYLFIVLTNAIACQTITDNKLPNSINSNSFVVPYQVDKPDKVFYMPPELNEISGLCYSVISRSLLTINDEMGYIYHIDKENGKTVKKVKFGKFDDYEGITSIGELTYVAESNGNIKVINETSGKRTTEYDDKLNSKNNIEGITYYPPKNILLLAAKGNSRKKGNKKSEKAIFEMNPTTGKIQSDPILSINLSDMVKSLSMDSISSKSSLSTPDYTRLKNFAPSGIAVHPSTNDIYIISASGKLLVICDINKNLKSVIFLNPTVHKQPEGICFDNTNTLYISNEGKGGQGSIYKYYSN